MHTLKDENEVTIYRHGPLAADLYQLWGWLGSLDVDDLREEPGQLETLHELAKRSYLTQQHYYELSGEPQDRDERFVQDRLFHATTKALHSATELSILLFKAREMRHAKGEQDA